VCPPISDHKKFSSRTKTERIVKEESKKSNGVIDRFRSVKEREGNKYEEVVSEIIDDYNDPIKEASNPLKSMKEDMFAISNMESDYYSSILTEDSPIMNIPSTSASKYNLSVSAAIKAIELKMTSGITLPKPLSLVKKRVEKKIGARKTD
jgi:hypothetical protein